MKLNEVKDYTLGVLRGTFKNKNVLDKISADGKNLRFEGKNLGDSYLFEGVENYSEDEIIVGRWIDGKPIYRKILEYPTSVTGNQNITLPISLTPYNIENMLESYFLSLYVIPCKVPIELFYTDGKWIYRAFDALGTPTSTRKIKLVIEYTKTTDAPGSSSDLINAPTNFVDGGVHSENETVVGQWIDGKPLYRVALKLKAPSTTNTWTNIKTIDDLDELVTLKGTALNTTENFKTTIPYGWDTSNNILFGCRGNNIQLYVASGGGFRNGDCNVVIEYTKTTDEPQDMSITSTLTTVASDEEVAEVFK